MSSAAAVRRASRSKFDGEILALASRGECDFFDIPLAPFKHPEVQSFRVTAAWAADVEVDHVQVRGWPTGTIPTRKTRSFLTSMPIACPINGTGIKTRYYNQFPDLAKDDPMRILACEHAADVYPGVQILSVHFDPTDRVVACSHLKGTVVARIGNVLRVLKGVEGCGHVYVRLDSRALQSEVDRQASMDVEEDGPERGVHYWESIAREPKRSQEREKVAC